MEYSRVYTGDVEKSDLGTMASTILIDEIENNLHCMEDFKSLINQVINNNPTLKKYMEENILLTPGDWGVWYDLKKIVCHWKDGDPKEILSIVPLVGPFHIEYNASYDTIATFKFIHQEVATYVFGKHYILAKKPKPWRVSLQTLLLLGGWLLIRSEVLSKFQQCKDIETTLLLHFLEEVNPIVHYFYSVIFRGGNRSLVAPSIQRMALLFISWKRKHYNKSILSCISDDHHLANKQQAYKHVTDNYGPVLSEKKVEIHHSILRKHTQPHQTPSQIQQTAQVLNNSKYTEKFEQYFSGEYNRGYGEKDISLICGE